MKSRSITCPLWQWVDEKTNERRWDYQWYGSRNKWGFILCASDGSWDQSHTRDLESVRWQLRHMGIANCISCATNKVSFAAQSMKSDHHEWWTIRLPKSWVVWQMLIFHLLRNRWSQGWSHTRCEFIGFCLVLLYCFLSYVAWRYWPGHFSSKGLRRTRQTYILFSSKIFRKLQALLKLHWHCEHIYQWREVFPWLY